MHLAPPFVSDLVQFLVIAVISSMLGAQAWAFSQLRSGRSWLPPARPPLACWGAGTVMFAFLAYILLNALAIAIVTSVAGPAPTVKLSVPAVPASSVAGDATSGSSFTILMLGSALGNAAAVVVLPLLLHGVARARLADLGLTVARLRSAVFAGVVAFLVVTPWVQVVHLVAHLIDRGEPHTLEKMLRHEASPTGVVLALVSAVILAPLAEELVFRGIIQAWLNRMLLTRVSLGREGREVSTAPPPGTGSAQTPPGAGEPERADPDAALTAATGRRFWLPVVLSSLLFAAMHIEVMPTPFPLFVLALALGYLYQRTGSLVASITLHALFNAFSTLLLLRVIL